MSGAGGMPVAGLDRIKEFMVPPDSVDTNICMAMLEVLAVVYPGFPEMPVRRY